MVDRFRSRNSQNECNITGITREELAIEDGLIFKAHRQVIPTSQRVEYLKDPHAGHLGKKKALLRAHETVVLPGIFDDVRNAVKLFDVYQKYTPAQWKEPMHATA